MGKHIKTRMDYDMIEQFAQEIARLDPENSVLRKFLHMDNFEGAELRKSVANIEPSREFGLLCTDCRG